MEHRGGQGRFSWCGRPPGAIIRCVNLILLAGEDLLPDGTARLQGRRARHIAEVHRAVPGDELMVGRIGGRMGRGHVVRASSDEVVLEVRLDQDPPAPPGIDLALAMPRPKVLRRLLRAVASLGVKRLVLLNSYRVEKSYFDSPLLAADAVREELLLGLEQARDTILPDVQVRQRFKPFVEDELGALWGAKTSKLLAHPTAPATLDRCRTGGEGEPAVIAIGPEGGWIPYEVQMLEDRGFEGFSLGPRILRVDTAVPFVLGELALARRLHGRQELVSRP